MLRNLASDWLKLEAWYKRIKGQIAHSIIPIPEWWLNRSNCGLQTIFKHCEELQHRLGTGKRF